MGVSGHLAVAVRFSDLGALALSGWRNHSASVPEEKDAVEGQAQSPACVARVELVFRLGVASDHDVFSAALVAIGVHHTKRQILGVHDQRCPDEISIHGISSSPPASFDLNDHAKLVVYRVNVVSDSRSPLLAKQDREGDALALGLARFNPVAKRFKPGPEDSQYLVAGQSSN